MKIARFCSDLGIAIIALGLVLASLIMPGPAGSQTPVAEAPAAVAPPASAPTADVAAKSAPPSEQPPSAAKWATPALSAAGAAARQEGASVPAAQPRPAQQSAAPATTDALPVEETPPALASDTTPSATPSSLVPQGETAAVVPPSARPAASPAAAPPIGKAGAKPDAVSAPPAAEPALKPAKVLFSAVKTPSAVAARSIGSYANGCIAGARPLPIDGPAWQVMRLSRNRNWGHPKLIDMVERLAGDAKSKDGWSGLLVGDLSQPRGGPMSSGHASHQVGLDVDIWLTPMPDRTLTADEREKMEAGSVLSEDGFAVSRDKWTDAHTNLIKRAASYPEVERVLVHPAIKQVLCHAAGDDRQWLAKVRPYWGHDEHIHVRIACPHGSGDCKPQAAVPGEDGCGKELDDWFHMLAKITPEPTPIPIPQAPAEKPKEKPQLTLLQLPQECRAVLAADNPDAAADIAAALAVEHGHPIAKSGGDKSKAANTLTASAAKLGGPKKAAESKSKSAEPSSK